MVHQGEAAQREHGLQARRKGAAGRTAADSCSGTWPRTRSLNASSLFQQSVPPIMAFHLGSLGFLTPFKFEDCESQVTHVLEGHAALTLRSRLRCILLKEEEERKATTPATNQLVLNEVVIDRGSSPYLSNIDLYLDGKLITSVQGDGLTVSHSNHIIRQKLSCNKFLPLKLYFSVEQLC